MDLAPDLAAVVLSSLDDVRVEYAAQRAYSLGISTLDLAFSWWSHKKGHFYDGWGWEFSQEVDEDVSHADLLAGHTPECICHERRLIAIFVAKLGWIADSIRTLQWNKDGCCNGAIPICVHWKPETSWKRSEGSWNRVAQFASPLLSTASAEHFPQESHTAYVQIILPEWVKEENLEEMRVGGCTCGDRADSSLELVDLPESVKGCPVVLIYAATGDQYFAYRREYVAKKLAKKDYVSVILGAPYYGPRRPPWQVQHWFRDVLQMNIMGYGIKEEAISLLTFLKGLGFEEMGLTGLSLGGCFAWLTALCVDYPLAVCPFMASSSPRFVFVNSVMNNDVAFDVLGGKDDCDPPNYRNFLKQRIIGLLFSPHSSSPHHLRGERRLSALFNRCCISEAAKSQPAHWNKSVFVQINAEYDHYIPQEAAHTLQAYLKRHADPSYVSMQWVPGGHVSGFLGTEQNRMYIEGICRSFELLRESTSATAK